jgi:hypothetical protein
VAICLALLVLPAISALAEALLVGADAPELKFALNRWLQNDEESPLPPLPRSQATATRRRSFFWRSDRQDAGAQGPWLAHLPREERIAVLRQPGGLSGRSWLHALDDQPLGRPGCPDDAQCRPRGHRRLHALGEARAAREALVILAAREHPGCTRSIRPASTPI